MAISITDAVAGILSDMYSLREAFNKDVVNYSALGRLIKPMVDQRMGTATGLESIVMAIRRYADSLHQKGVGAEVQSVISACTLMVETDFVALDFKHWRAHNISTNLFRLLSDGVDWHAGEKIYVVLRDYELTLVANNKFVAPIMEIFSKSERSKLMGRRDGVAVVTISTPQSNSPELYAFFTDQFVNSQIPIVNMFQAYRNVSFVIDEINAAKAYSVLSRAISTARMTAGETPSITQDVAKAHSLAPQA